MTNTKTNPDALAWEEYDSAADWCARRGLKGVLGDLLPELLSLRCVKLINDDPEAFERRVSETAYANAMESHQTSALQRAIESLGAVYLSADRYAVKARGLDGYAVVSGTNLRSFADTLDASEALDALFYHCVSLPTWWTPERRSCRKVVTPQSTIYVAEDDYRRHGAPRGAKVERITADLTTGEERPC